MAYVLILVAVVLAAFWFIQTLGKGWRENNTPQAARESTKKVIVVLGAILCFALITAYNVATDKWDEYQSAAASKERVAKLTADKEALKISLIANKASVINKIREFQVAGDLTKALAETGKYQLVQDKEIQALAVELNNQTAATAKKKEIQGLVEGLKKTDDSDTDGRLKGYEKLTILVPDNPEYKQKKAIYQKRQTAESAEALKAERAEKRKKGVYIGMTMQDVLDSSWGRPEQVNRTTTRYSEREQWVYGGHHSYLYFEDGKLTSIQN
ncbi:MAG: hypothetical protein ABIQ90_13630 [Polaromonas sp.]